MSTWQERYTPEGFWQCREIYDSGGNSGWLYYISGFSDPQDGIGIAHVRAKDGIRECKIDGKNRLLIGGKWTRKWNH